MTVEAPTPRRLTETIEVHLEAGNPIPSLPAAVMRSTFAVDRKTRVSRVELVVVSVTDPAPASRTLEFGDGTICVDLDDSGRVVDGEFQRLPTESDRAEYMEWADALHGDARDLARCVLFTATVGFQKMTRILDVFNRYKFSEPMEQLAQAMHDLGVEFQLRRWTRQASELAA